jgi:hypothetical protein
MMICDETEEHESSWMRDDNSLPVSSAAARAKSAAAPTAMMVRILASGAETRVMIAGVSVIVFLTMQLRQGM